VAAKDAGRLARQKGQACSLTRTCRAHEGQGASAIPPGDRHYVVPSTRHASAQGTSVRALAKAAGVSAAAAGMLASGAHRRPELAVASLSSASQESPQRHGWSHEKPLVGLGPGTAIDPTGVIRQAERDREDRFIGRVPSTSASRVRTAKTIAGQVTALALRDAAISAGLRNVAPYTMRHPGTPHTVALGNGWETAWGPGGPLSRCILTPRRGSSRWPRSHDF
jgi:hypothetical protein